MATPQTHRFGQFVRRLHSLRESYDHAVIDDLMPTFDVLRPNPELYKLRDERLFSTTFAQPAVAAQNARITLQAGPGTIAVIEQITLETVSAGFQFVNIVEQFGITYATPAGSFPGQVTDLRGAPLQLAAGQEVAGQTRCILNGTTVAGFVNAPGRIARYILNSNNGTVEYHVKWVLFGGRRTDTASAQIWFQMETVNIDLSVGVQGYERYLEESEFKDAGV